MLNHTVLVVFLLLNMQEFSPDDRFIASSDRDFKIRVRISFLDYLVICGTLPVVSEHLSYIHLQITAFPKQPLKGALEIQSFCLGHKE